VLRIETRFPRLTAKMISQPGENLDTLLAQAGLRPELCFRTNWFIGLLPGETQTGKFLRRPDQEYERACNNLLIKQIKALRPAAILILGPEVASRAYQLIPSLAPWRDTRRWVDIDRSVIGHSLRKAHVPGADLTTNIAALLHPSSGVANQSRRMANMATPVTEAEIVREALRA
jgi:uracil-DNA glycosylase